MQLPFIIVSIIALFIGLINLIYMIKIAKRTNEIQDEKLLNIDEDANNILSKFRKVTTDKMRLLDNKIKIADDVLQDLESSIENAYSQLNILEEKINNIQKANTNYNQNKKKNILNEQLIDKQINEENLIKKEKTNNSIDTYESNSIGTIENSGKIKEETKQKIQVNNEETKSEKIRRLLKEGNSPDQIAKKLKIGMGEVILVENLDRS
ncbi:hypothetical protein [Geotoga petraea]|jgi:hypothetical protein|uniref:DUF2802 domain-containing protein n=1 Tax=Geotoga petraea TaxID=28234 RepID=A0A1G6IK80_9BACT|nr:hypothetical protein [Geotoga petraea]MDK2945282.1 hypothetical protein [Geotoga sp.]TGG89228.1 hypothetical protein E4650_03305 [Geotoga petraea]SDC06898.1 hypothetical protein SAMN04488588_0407 [Geotoga petraea]